MADMKLLLIFLAIIAPYCVMQASGGCVLTQGYSVEIVSQLPLNSDDLLFHCQSKDTDLGFHNLTMDEGYKWDFCDNYLHTTLYFCHFWWGADHSQAFDVFNHRISPQCAPTESCYWVAKSDGFYFTNDFAHGTWTRVYAWN